MVSHCLPLHHLRMVRSQSVLALSTVTLTCTASQDGTMGWMDQNGLIVTFNVEEASRVVYHGPYTVTLVTVDNRDTMGTRGDLNSTLVVTVDDGFENGTDITCQVFGNQDHLLIYKIGI